MQKACLIAVEGQLKRQIESDGICSYGEADTPLGRLHIVWCPQGLLLISFQTDSGVPGLNDLRQRLNYLDWQRDDMVSQELSRQLLQESCSLPLLFTGTSFQLAVLHAIQTVPCGRSVTYKWIANEIDRPSATRAVGNALGANPFALAIPCHRALRSDGGLGGFRWGIALKEKLLKEEQQP